MHNSWSRRSAQPPKITSDDFVVLDGSLFSVLILSDFGKRMSALLISVFTLLISVWSSQFGLWMCSPHSPICRTLDEKKTVDLLVGVHRTLLNWSLSKRMATLLHQKMVALFLFPSHLFSTCGHISNWNRNLRIASWPNAFTLGIESSLCAKAPVDRFCW